MAISIVLTQQRKLRGNEHLENFGVIMGCTATFMLVVAALARLQSPSGWTALLGIDLLAWSLSVEPDVKPCT